jgi:ABC-2 type transport system ATP-binding protein
LRDSDIDVDDIGLSRPSLDDVFLRLTGHRTEQEAET